MRTGYEVLGNYIRLVDKRNRDLSITNLLGVSIEKRFIPSIANIIGTDLSNYKVVQTGQFAYWPCYFKKMAKNITPILRARIASFQAPTLSLRL